MSVRSGQSVTKVFTTRAFSSGAATNADSTPTGTLYLNGTSNAASVTVTNITTGLYKAAVTLPTLAVGDIVDLRISATVSGVTDNAIVWSDTKDVVFDTSGLVDANAVKVGPTGSGTAQTARDLGANLDVVVSTRMATYTQPTGFLAATFPGTVASTTNITAGTMTTVATVNALAAGTITAASIATDAITAAKIADGAIDAATFATGAIDANAIAANAIGASELATDAVNEIAAGVWDLATSGHTTASTFGAAMVAAGAAGDPWTTALPGAYGSNSAGFLLGTYLDVLVSSRLATAGYTVPPTTAAVADRMLGRNLAGGSDGGRTVAEALAASRNRVAFDVPSSGQFTVFADDDATPLWTGTYSTDAGAAPVTGLNPA